MNLKSLKKFISLFILASLLLSFFLPYFQNIENIAASVIQTSGIAESIKPTSHGFKIENAEYWDYNENYDKSRIWIDQGNGGNGSGGGAGGDYTASGGNGGASSDAGGILGHAAGIGLGTGNFQNIAGAGGSNQGVGAGSGQGGNIQGNVTQGGTSGSSIADALRSLKMEIEESRAESIAKVLESALNQSFVAASIAESESLAESIQKKLKQEAIKSRVLPKETAPPETQKVYETIPNIPQQQPTYRRETIAATSVAMPTADQNVFRETMRTPERVGMVINNKETTVHEIDAVDMIKAQINKDVETVVEQPTSEALENTIAPAEMQEYIDTGFEPGDFIETEAMTQAINVPQPETTSVEEVKKETVEEEKSDDEEEGEGAKGGEDAEADEDKEGDEGSDESKGNAADKGAFHKEESEEYKGKKIFELENNGDIGLESDRMSNISARFVITVLSITLFILGGIVYLLSTRDKKSKKNYF